MSQCVNYKHVYSKERDFDYKKTIDVDNDGDDNEDNGDGEDYDSYLY